MDDQQVPDSGFDVVSSDAGISVITAPKTYQSQRSIPDLDEILTELDNTNLEYNAGFMTDDVIYLDMDTKMYEEGCGANLVKQEPKTMDKTSCAQAQSEWSPEDMLLREEREKIQYACVALDLPDNPYKWTAEQVQKWIRWTLSLYNLQEGFAENFWLDGTSLCMLSKQDMVCRSSHAGEYLYAELDIWKNASNISMMSSPQEEELSTFADMETVNASNVCNFRSVLEATDIGLCMPLMSSTAPPLGDASSTMNFMDMTFNEEIKPTFGASFGETTGNGSSAIASSSMSDWSLSSSGSSGSLGNSLDGSLACSRALGETRTDLSVLTSKYRGTTKQTIHLWQFLKELLLQPHMYEGCIRWQDQVKGIFKIEDSVRVAKLWGQRKNRPAMNYDKLSRSIRQYYKKGIIKKTASSKRLVYQFCAPYV